MALLLVAAAGVAASSVGEGRAPAGQAQRTTATTATTQAGTTEAGTTQAGPADATPPETTITSGPSGTVNSASASFQFEASEPASFQCSLDGASFAACGSPQAYTGLAEGEHTFAVRAVDLAGNVDPSPAERSWTVKARAFVSSGPSGVVASRAATFLFGSEVAGARFECSLDGAKFAPCVSPKTYSDLFEGGHDFQLKVFDPAGNVVGEASQEWDVDLSAPIPSGDTLIDFDAFPPGTVIDTEYKQQGVEFGYTWYGTSGISGVLPVVREYKLAHSKPQVGETPACSLGFCIRTIYGRLTNLQTHLKLYAGAGPGVKVRLTAYDMTGKVLAEVAKKTTVSAKTPLAVSAPKGKYVVAPKKIAFFSVSEDEPPGAQHHALRIDDVSFAPPDPGAEPDFSLVWTATPTNVPLTIKKPDQVKTTIVINRFNGFTGSVKLSVEAGTLPKGVTDYWGQYAVTTLPKAELWLTVGNDAPSFSGEITVVGVSANGKKRTLKIPLLVHFGKYDLYATGLEVTQGIQGQQESYQTADGKLSPALCADRPSLPARNYWSGISGLKEAVKYTAPMVKLVEGRQTIVRFFAVVASPKGEKVEQVPALLRGYRLWAELPGSPLSPLEGPRDLSYSSHPWVTCAQRASAKGAYTFVLPPEWAKGTIRLEAEVMPALFSFDGFPLECDTAECAANNRYKLAEIAFTKMGWVEIVPVAITDDGKSPPPPFLVFAPALMLTPGEVRLAGLGLFYAGEIDVSEEAELSPNSERCSWVMSALGTWANDNDVTVDSVVGVVSSGKVCFGLSDQPIDEPGGQWALVAPERPLTSVAHELGHGYDRPHAGDEPSCYKKQPGEPWEPDHKGYLRGFGLDLRSGPPYKVLYHHAFAGAFVSKQPKEMFDFMSYCASTDESAGDSWISEKGWDDTLDFLHAYQDAEGRIAAGGGAVEAAGATVRVRGYAADSGVRIAAAGPARGPAKGDRSSSLSLRSVNGAGAVVSESPLRTIETHADGDGSGPITFLEGEVPGAGAAAVEIARDGVVVARRVRSAHPPRVRVLAPKPGARVGGRPAVEVAWRSSDADGGVRTARLAYSTDDGRTWRTIFSGPDRGRATLRSSYFSRSSRARVRVTVNDGFDEGSAVSGRFTAVGRPPGVLILSPRPGQRTLSDATLYLEGRAYDDAGRPLGGKAVRWLAGKRLLGTGLKASATGLPPGVNVIRLVARDAQGRVGTASVRVRVLAAAPHLLELKAPRRLAATARRLSFRLATTIPATLTVAGRRFAVDRRPRRVTVPVRPGRKPLRVALTLTAGAKTTRLTLVVPRG